MIERITQINPAWDKRNPDPKKDYGIHCMQVWMILKGKQGAIHFTWSTGIFLKETEERLAANGTLNWEKLGEDHYFSVAKAMGYDVGYHARKPQFDGQEVRWPTKMHKKKKDETGMTLEQRVLNVRFTKIGKKAPKCEWLGVPCYCDGSAMRAEEWFNILKAEGSEKIWKMMEADYKHRFGKLV